MPVASGGDSPRAFDRFATWCVHRVTWIYITMAVSILLPRVVKWLGLPDLWAQIISAFFAGAFVLFIVAVYGQMRHDEISCDKCRENFALDAPGEAAEKKESLRRFHLFTSVKFAVFNLGLLVLSFFPWTWWTLGILYITWALQSHYAHVHRPLTPWCPWCYRRDDDDDDEPVEVPDPVPPAMEKDRV